MLNHKLLFIIIGTILSGSTYAYDAKDGNVTALVAPFVYKTIFPDTATCSTSRYKGDFALIIGGDINQKGSLEISIFHMNKQFFREEGLKSIVQEVQLMHIGMGYRRWLHPYLSAAIAFYSAYPMDDAKTIHSDFTPGLELTTSAQDKTEYGIDLSIQSEIWGNDRVSVVTDARYAYSITSQPDEKAHHYGLAIGVKFLVQEKFPDTKEKL